jgi:RHS repeat-associated protein
LTGITTFTSQFFLTDALGSVLATFSATAGSAAVLGNQVYGPYGNQRYTQGSMGTAKGYTGQYADATGLDYYNARYYDPIVGRFVSADTVQGNEQGMDPYAYVMGNPETMNDPTGKVAWLFVAATVIAAAAAAVVILAASPVIISIATGIAVGYVASVGIDLIANGIPRSDQAWDTMGLDAIQSEVAGGIGGFYSAPTVAAQTIDESIDPIGAKLAANRALNAAQTTARASGLKGGVFGPAAAFGVRKILEKHIAHAAVRKTSVVKKTVAPRRTYTHTSTRSSSTWTQTSSGYNSYTQSNYSYSDTVYHYTNPSYNYSVFSSSNGYYQVTRGGIRMS